MSSAAGHISIVLGIVLRLWAAGYIGSEARKTEFTAAHVIKSGPYELLKHPLYIGNFFLVLGVVMLYNPPRWIGVLYIVTFVIMYTIIALSEHQYLKGRSVKYSVYKFSNLKGELSTGIVLLVAYLIFLVLRLRS